MEWWEIALLIAALLSIVAIIYQYIKLRQYLKSAEEETVEQAEPQIRKYFRNGIILIVFILILAILAAVMQNS